MCDSQCCPESAQLCVDASFFVPMTYDSDCVYFLNFENVNVYLSSDSAKYLPSTTGTTEFNWDLNTININGTKIANIKTKVNSDSSTQKISLESISIEGLNRHLSINDDVIYDNSSASAANGMLTLNNLLSLVELTDTEYKNDKGYAQLTLSEQKRTGRYFHIMLNSDVNNYIGELYFQIINDWDENTKEATVDFNLTILNLEAYPNAPDNTNGFNPIANISSTNVPFPIPQYIASLDDAGITHDNQNLAINISNAALMLQLRANKNVLNADADIADPENFPAGDYDICVSFKDCEGEFVNLNVFRITIKQDRTIVGKWGKDTTKSNQIIADKHDSAMLKSTLYKAVVSSCGSLDGVFNNTNDFVICVEKIMQLFPLFGEDSLITIDDSVTAQFNTAHENYPVLYATLGNTKLYLSIKYVVCIHDEHCIDEKPHQMCKGQLNPFDKQGQTYIKGYTIAEITNMMDHPVMESNLSREITLCISSNDVLESDRVNDYM